MAILVELEEVAMVDGCSRAKAFRIFVPLASPGIVGLLAGSVMATIPT